MEILGDFTEFKNWNKRGTITPNYAFSMFVSSMIFADDIKKAILQTVSQQGSDVPFNPEDVAKSIDPKNWPLLIDRVKLVAESMIQQGQLPPKIKYNNN
jgi:hypothetical protein